MRQYENPLYTAIVILILAFFSFRFTFTLWTHLSIFVIYSVAIFNVEKIGNKIWGEIKLNDEDKAILAEIKSANLSDEEKKEAIKKQFPKMSAAQSVALIVLAWCMLLEMYMCAGLARILAQFSMFQELAGWIPSQMFLEHNTQRSETMILYLKVYKLSQIITFPFMLWSCYVLIQPFLRLKEFFSILPSFVFLDKSTTRGQKVKKAIWGGVATFVFIFLTFGLYLFLFKIGYTDSEYARAKFTNPRLSLDIWFYSTMVVVFVCLCMSCFIEIVVDWYFLICNFFKGESHGR
jgi:hypothetical protein